MRDSNTIIYASLGVDSCFRRNDRFEGNHVLQDRLLLPHLTRVLAHYYVNKLAQKSYNRSFG